MYRSTHIDSAQQLSQQKQLVLLLNGLLERIHLAERSMQAADIAAKTQAIAAALRILEALRGSLDFDVGGELSEQLAQIYDTASIWLAEANAGNDLAKLARVAELLQPIAEAYSQLPDVEAESGR